MGTLPNAVEITKVGSIMCSGMCAMPFTHVNFVLRGNNLRLLFANVVVDCNIVVDRKKNMMVHIFKLIFSSLILCYLLSVYHICISIKKSISPPPFYMITRGENSPDIYPQIDVNQ